MSVLKEVHSEMKSQSSMDVLGEIDNSLSEDPILTYIKQSRECLGLDTVPSQHMSDVSTSVTMRESLLVSSAPITGVKDLKVLSRRLSGFDSPTKRDSTVEFVYAVAKENSRGCSVYDLCITEPDRAKAQESYYTVSAFNVSEVRWFNCMVLSHIWLFILDMQRRWNGFHFECEVALGERSIFQNLCTSILQEFHVNKVYKKYPFVITAMCFV